VSIYIPRHFVGDEATAHRLIADYPFATLITSAAPEPSITYIPMLLEDGALVGHIARANPHWQKFADGPTVALFHGPHAFVSPRWYETPSDNVPTWNYAVVHAHGRPQPQEGHTQVHLEQLAAHFDGGRPLPTDPAKVQRMLNGVVAFRMPIDRLEIKFKMNQNKSAADRRGVMAGLRGTGRADDAAVAAWMAAHEPG
jgi:transcriptional regulator